MQSTHGIRSTDAKLVGSSTALFAHLSRERPNLLNLSFGPDGRRQDIRVFYPDSSAVEHFEMLVGPLDYTIPVGKLEERFELTGPWKKLLRGDSSLADYLSPQEVADFQEKQRELSSPCAGVEFEIMFRDFRDQMRLTQDELAIKAEKGSYILYSLLLSDDRKFKFQEIRPAASTVEIQLGSFRPASTKPFYREWAELLLTLSYNVLPSAQTGQLAQ